MLSSGEQISSSKLSILLNELGYKSISLTGWQAGIYTNNTNQNAIINNIDTSRILHELQEGNIVIIAGFQGINSNLDITTFGRGGSDTTAVAVASALKSKHCYIFSDVDGVYTTDPNKYSKAKKLQTLSYTEMLEISNEGAKVLHNRCVEIGEKFKIPIITKSTFNNKSGTVIDDKIEDKSVKSIVKNDNLVLVNLKHNSYSLELYYKVYNSLISNNILPIHFANNSLSSFDIDFLIKNTDVNKLQKLLDVDVNMFETKIQNTSRIAIIGYSISTDNTILQKAINVVKQYNMDIFKIDVTNTKLVITFYENVDDNLLEALHKKLIEA